MAIINHYMSRRIAENVALKAFGPGLKAPAIAVFHALHKAQQETFSQHKVSASLMDNYLIPSGAFCRYSNGSDVVMSYYGEEHCLSVAHILDATEIKALPPLYLNQRGGYSYFVHLSEKASASDAINALAHLTDQRKPMHNFAYELASQLEGKTPAAAMKALPEVADIIAGLTGANAPSKNPITVPLEALIKKHMAPALPAPATAAPAKASKKAKVAA